MWYTLLQGAQYRPKFRDIGHSRQYWHIRRYGDKNKFLHSKNEKRVGVQNHGIYPYYNFVKIPALCSNVVQDDMRVS